MTTMTAPAPEINVAQDPVQPQGGAGDCAGTNNADGSKFDSLMKSEKTALEGSETELQDNLQDEEPKPAVPLIALPETFVIAAGIETPNTAGTEGSGPVSPVAETPQAKNNPQIIQLPATVTPGEMIDINAGTKGPGPVSPVAETPQAKNNPQIIQLPATGTPGEMININAGTKGTGHEINQAPEDKTVLSVLKDQENVINTSAEREKLYMALREMAGRGGKEIKNFTPINVKEPAGETILKNQSDISVKHSDQTGRVSEIENTSPGSGSTITSGGQKTVDKPFLETVQRPSGFSEVLDKIVYVVKNNRSMDVSVMHEGNRLKINLTMNNGMLNVNINTNEAVMRELIESNIQNIVDSLEKDGVNISEFSVNLKDRKHNNNNDRENTFNHDMPARGVTPPAHIMSVNSGTGAVNIFV